MPTEEHGMIAMNIGFALRSYVQQHKSGRVGAEVRHRMPSDNRNSRLPDVSYSTAQRPLITKGSVPEMPDLAVEIQSPDDSLKAMRATAAYYLEHGAKLVWLIYPPKRLVEVFYADGEVDLFREGELLSGETVLPGFTLPVADIFADPFTDEQQ
jgi:Uma2 family endonuclease